MDQEKPNGNDLGAIAQELERSRRDVLDLTLRNPLLNFRELKAKGLAIVDEIPSEVYGRLVLDERAMFFEPACTEEEPYISDGRGPQSEEPPRLFSADNSDPDEATRTRTKKSLLTPYEVTRLESLLKNTYRHAQLSIEEQGVNILYLALGMLNWYESDSSEIELNAPLILIPVKLSQANVQARFKVEWTGEEIDSNLSLETRLRSDFGIELPEIGDIEDLVVEAYFRAIGDAVSSKSRWSVQTTSAYLGFFSFSKLLIYKDLDPVSWPTVKRPDGHPLIQSLFGSTGFREDPSVISVEDSVHDGLQNSEIHQVVDSDSSQTLAIHDVNNGRNLVIQGPPGTGKSQTITNLIAEAIMRNKTVLFVAEKMAALEVVKRRLDSVHIGDACLELHSHTANKRAVLDELKRTCTLGKPQFEDPNEKRQLLEDRRRRLNGYVQAVNTIVGETGFTPHELIGMLDRIVRFDSIEKWPVLPLDGLANWDRRRFTRCRDAVVELRALINSIDPPRKHLFGGTGRTRYLPTERNVVRDKLQTGLESVERHKTDVDALCTILGPRVELSAVDQSKVETLVKTARRAIEAPSVMGINHCSANWIIHRAALRGIIANAIELIQIRKELGSALMDEAWNSDVYDCRTAIATYRDKWWRFFSREYLRARKCLRGLCRHAVPKDKTGQLALIDSILRFQRLQKDIENSRELILHFFPNLQLDWEPATHQWLAETATWALELHLDIANGTLDGCILEILERETDKDKLRQAVAKCEASSKALSVAIDEVSSLLEWRVDRFSDGLGFLHGDFSTMRNWFFRAQNEVDSLNDVVRFNQMESRLTELGIKEVADAAAVWDEAGKHLLDLFEYVCFSAWLEKAFAQRPSLSEFDGETHKEVIDGFCKLDMELIQNNRAEVAHEHWERLPREHGGGQIAVLRREFEKKRRHLPLRRLMTNAGNAIQKIKPVFMMSPLSIAKFVPPNSVDFDLVIFDEASQVRPVEALGAVLRCQQAVVVGDSKQLPPTSFFDRMNMDEEDEEAASETVDLESILGMFLAQGAPARMLRWHYRSRHESLINVSNSEFYDNRLVVFPSPERDRKDVGLYFQPCPTMPYRRGHGGKYNVGEARTIANAVMEHARNSPNLTLGVAAFGLPQARRIEDELEALRRMDTSSEPFFGSHPNEPFFVKNLENVQGDERDVILISVGYGKDEHGYMSMNFGPINREGGERRLNVLITRARRRCVVYSNFNWKEIDLNRTNAQGVRSLKSFLRYAETGVMDVPVDDGREPDSPFEEAVGNALSERGYEVHYQVGSAGFFIDLAVVDSRHRGRYLIGIECDGRAYHSSKSARDRDRLRQEVLEDLGWTIHRIWSTDWFRNPRQQLARVEEAIKRARSKEYRKLGQVTKITENGFKRNKQKFANVRNETKPYKLSTPVVQLVGEELHNVANARMLVWIQEVVEVESPVHINEVALRISNAAGLRRTGKRIRQRVHWAVARGVREKKLVRKGDFLWRTNQGKVSIRRRGDVPNSLRRADMIAPQEIKLAMVRAVQASHGISSRDAVAEAGRLFGYKRIGADLRTSFRLILDGLILQETLLERDGQLTYNEDSHGDLEEQ